MTYDVWLGFIGGIITGLSPCIVPVVPVIVAGGGTGASRWRPYMIIAGLVTSFTVATLVGGSLLSLLHLPQDVLLYIGIGALLLLGISLLVPPLERLIEKPFARLGAKRQAQETSSGFVLGLSLGLVYVPCAGPALAAISTRVADHRIGFTIVAMMIAYAIGSAIPLLIVAVASRRATVAVASIRSHARTIRHVAGVVLALTAVALIPQVHFPLLTSLQKSAPGYAQSLSNFFENNTSAQSHLDGLTGHHDRKLLQAAGETLPKIFTAPDFKNVTAWINTGDHALNIRSLRGKVVLVDFWTYSCINCLRSLPHVEGWYRTYHGHGLVVVGVHTPEFAFEHVVSNVRSEVASLGIAYPVAVDDAYATWNAYQNQYWPAEYLIDANGEVRYTSFGEGDYPATETAIRELLTLAGQSNLPAGTDTPNRTPSEPTTPESYLGYGRLNNAANLTITPDRLATYRFPASLPADYIAFDGQWKVSQESAAAGQSAELRLNFTANDVYLVLGGTGTVRVLVDGQPSETVKVSGIPDLYTMYSGHYRSALMQLDVSTGVVGYDFTFG